MIEPGQVTAVIPTRGNVDMGGIIESLEDAGYGEIIIADKERYGDMGIYKRFLAAMDAKFSVVYTQDDDIIFRQHSDLLWHYKPGVVTTAYPQPYNIPWISTGAIFDKDLVQPAFDRYLERYPFDEFMTHKAADVVFYILVQQIEVIPMPYEELAWANDAGRCSTSEGWYDRDRPLAWDRCIGLR